MQRNTTLNLPNDLVQRTKAYAAQHGTTMTAIIRAHLVARKFTDLPDGADEPATIGSSWEPSPATC